MKKSSALRVGIDLFLIVAVVYFPWWISFPIAIMGGLFFNNFYELAIIGIWIDSIKLESMNKFFPIFFALGTIFFFLTKKIRKQTTF